MKKLLLFTVFILQAIISHAQFKVCGTPNFRSTMS